MALHPARTANGALAGALAAAVWAAQQPLDRRLFDSDYDDVEWLGKGVTRGDAWYPIGLALHIGNGAVFGAAFANLAPRVALPWWTRGTLAALGEHVALWPLARVSDRLHPASDELPALAGNRRAFWQAAWRHLLFGLLLSALEHAMNARRR
jgi:hypothetical protein